MDSQQEQIAEFGSVKQETQNSNNEPKKFDLPSFKCNACSYVSIWKHAVKRHQQTHYRGMNIPPESKRKKYQCKHCSFAGNNWKKLQEHQNLHLSQKLNKSEEQSSGDEDEKPDKPKHKPIKEAKESPNGEIKDPQSNPVVLDDNIKKSTISKAESTQSRLKNYLEKAEENKFGKDDEEKDMLRCTRCGVANDCEAQFEQHMKLHESKLKVEETTSVIKRKKSDLNSEHNKLNQKSSAENLQNKISAIQDNKDLVVKTTGTKPVARTRRGKFFDVPVKMTKNGLFQCEHCSYQTAIRTALVKHQTNHLKNANS